MFNRSRLRLYRFRETSVNSLSSVSQFVGAGDISPVSHCWSSCDSGLGCCEYSVAAVDELRWPASVERAASIRIANALLRKDGVLSMSYICFVVHNIVECLLWVLLVPVTTGAV